MSEDVGKLVGTKLEAQWIPELENICQRLETFELSSTAEPGLIDAEQFLIQAKTDFAFIWSLVELNSIEDHQRRGRLQTRFAEATIQLALRIAWCSAMEKHRELSKVPQFADGIVTGLFIFGMGKLGGYDLNFSSDVDLVAYYDPELLPVPELLGRSYVCQQILLKLTKVLGQGGQSNFIWRVDWRLRPNASANALAMSTEAATEYYFYQASPWHRLALMKARVVAGDMQCGADLLNQLRPFIWRQNLDYRALDELAEIKQRINLEHPALRTQRQWREPINDDVNGFNVKLGSGGIREIEFIANALQLIWGGRLTQLREPNTVDALAALATTDSLPKDVCERLAECYRFLRRLENAIQIQDNQQTHLIPESESKMQELLLLLDLATWPELVAQLNDVRLFVNERFEDLFAEQAAANEEAPVWPEDLSDAANEVIDGWEDGYHSYGVSNQVRHRLTPLTRAIANYLGEFTGDDANDVVIRLHEFFRSLPIGEQYFRLLAESPKLLNSIIPPLLYSPPMTVLLKQSPHIIDCFVRDAWQYPEPFDSSYVIEADQYDERLERLRRFVNEHLYQLYLSFIEGHMAVDEFQTALTELAEHTLDLSLNVVANHLDLDSVPITVIGMGKVALKRMSPLSDLDLIFVFDSEATSLESASRFVSRLRTAISVPMREGIVYDLDERLRPSGRAGAPTISIDSYATHQHQRAHTWEHIALMPSRVIAGNKKPEEQLAEIKSSIVKKPRQKDQFLRDALKMWNRIATNRIDQTPPEQMNAKLRVGGLMQAEYLAACLILQHESEQCLTDFDQMLEEAVQETELAKLPEIIQFWRIQQLWERLLGHKDKMLSELPPEYLARLLEHSEVKTMEELIDKKTRYTEVVTKAMEKLFEDLKMNQQEIDDWQEQSIIWG